MKICMFLDNPISRDPRVKAEAKALAAAGNDVTVVGTMAKDTPAYEEWEGVKFLRINAQTGKAAKAVNCVKSLTSVLGGKKAYVTKYKENNIKMVEKKYIDRVEGRGFEVFHANDLQMLPPAAEAAKRAGARLVYDSHEFFDLDYFVKGRKLPEEDIAYYNLLLSRQAEYIKKADMVVTVCDNAAKLLMEKHSLKDMPVVLYNTAELREKQKLNILRDEYLHTPNGRPIVLYQGVVSWGRGLEKFVKIALGNPDADFVIIGPVAKKSLYDRLVSMAGEAKNIFFLKPVPYEKLWQITLSADFGYYNLEPMNTSYEIAVGNKLFEYLAASLPILAGESKGSAEIRDKISEHYPDDENPIVLIPKNDDEAAEYVKSVLSSDRAAKLSDNAYEVAEKYYNQSIELEKIVNAYNGLMK